MVTIHRKSSVSLVRWIVILFMCTCFATAIYMRMSGLSWSNLGLRPSFIARRGRRSTTFEIPGHNTGVVIASANRTGTSTRSIHRTTRSPAHTSPIHQASVGPTHRPNHANTSSARQPTASLNSRGNHSFNRVATESVKAKSAPRANSTSAQRAPRASSTPAQRATRVAGAGSDTPATATQAPTVECLSDLCSRNNTDGCCCLFTSADIGNVTLLQPDLVTVPKLDDVVARYAFSGIQSGGCWAPTRCKPEQQLAVIVPFRNREEHLVIFVNHMHAYLQRQLIAYCIYVVDQVDERPFNRAMLFNVGFAEAMKQINFTCAAFHDVDNLPVDPILSYWCESQPTHMSTRTDKWKWGMPYVSFAGGVTKQLTRHVYSMNGFTNIFWGWGGEDDELSMRWHVNGFRRRRPPSGHGNYATIKRHHSRGGGAPSFDRMKAIRATKERHHSDGLSELKYELLSIKATPLFTRLSVKLMKNPKYDSLYGGTV